MVERTTKSGRAKKKGKARKWPILENKPLIEAIFELRWKLADINPENTENRGYQVDPDYSLLVGTLYSALKKTYPYHEKLQTADLPAQLSAYTIQHRFRKIKDGWPLVQVGPGIFVCNDTDSYVWESFESNVSAALKALYKLHPTVSRTGLTQLMLRYIDAVPLDSAKSNQDVLRFLESKMKLTLRVSSDLFESSKAEKNPEALDIRMSHRCKRPSGIASLRFATGDVKGKRSVVWETLVHSTQPGLPNNVRSIMKWLNEAHDLTDEWFFTLIEGELLRKLK